MKTEAPAAAMEVVGGGECRRLESEKRLKRGETNRKSESVQRFNCSAQFS